MKYLSTALRLYTYANGDGTIHGSQRSKVSITYAPTAEASEAILRVIIKQIPRQAAGVFNVDSEDEVVDIEVYSCVLRGNGHLARLDVAPGAVAFPRAIYLGEAVSSTLSRSRTRHSQRWPGPSTTTNALLKTVRWCKPRHKPRWSGCRRAVSSSLVNQ